MTTPEDDLRPFCNFGYIMTTPEDDLRPVHVAMF